MTFITMVLSISVMSLVSVARSAVRLLTNLILWVFAFAVGRARGVQRAYTLPKARVIGMPKSATLKKSAA